MGLAVIAGRASAQSAETQPPPAAGEKPKPSPAELKQAKQDSKDGLKLLKSGDLQSALPKLEGSYAVDPTPSTLRGIADCQRGLGHNALAYAKYEELLGTYSAKLSKKDKADSERAFAELGQLTGTLLVGGVPAGALVDVDGAAVAPEAIARPVRLDPGKHVVQVTHGGFEPFQSEVEVQGGQEVPVPVTLAPEIKTGHVKVAEATGKVVRVLIDGQDVGPAPWEGELAPGHHLITVSAPGLAAQPTGADVVAKGSLELSIVATPVPPPSNAHYALTLDPPSARVTLNGQPVSALTGELAPGTYTLEVSAPGYASVTKSITVTAAQPYAESIRLLPVKAEPRSVRPGVLIGIISLPRPIEAEVGVKIKDMFGVGAQYSMLPTVTFPGKDAKLDFYAIRGVARWFPFSGAFYLGAGVGVQTFKASISQSVSSGNTSGTMTTTADASTAFIAPELGWLWTFNSGFTVGLNAGVQIPISSPPGTSSTVNGQTVPSSCPANAPPSACDSTLAAQANSSAKDVDQVVEIIAKTPVPNLDLLKLGFFF